MGMVTMYRCGYIHVVDVVVRRYIDIHNNYKFSLLHLYILGIFWQQHPYFFVHF